ncbi:MAG: hypothetical protein JO079_07185 [Frankiaceae bacterium]|nr:hypothetical protein [Frankiaceae bacterium]
MPRTDLRSLPRNDLAFLGLGLLVLVASFLPWYGTHLSLAAAGIKVSKSTSTWAWHRWTALGVLLVLIATAIVALQRFGEEDLPELKVPWNVVVLGIDAVGALLIVVKSLDQPSVHNGALTAGLRWGAWVLIVAALAHVAVAALRLRTPAEPAGLSAAEPTADPAVE